MSGGNVLHSVKYGTVVHIRRLQQLNVDIIMIVGVVLFFTNVL